MNVMQLEQERFVRDFRVNKKILRLDMYNNRDEIIVHHYLIHEMYKNCSFDVMVTLRDIEYRTKLELQKVRRAINKLEEKGIIEVEKGHGKKSNKYRYIIG